MARFDTYAILYFSNLFLAAGIGVMASRLGWVFMVTAMWVFVSRLILFEEGGLRQEQGESYARYSRAVPRFLPSPVARVPSSDSPLVWAQAFAGESLI